jgi:hypothetical protein
MQALQPYSVTAPGFFGLNLEDSPTDLQSGYALIAQNCIIDQYGRVGARKGWTKVNTASGTLGSNAVEAIGEHTANDGTSTTIVAGNNKIFKLSGTSLVELTYGGGGVAPTITASNWSMVSLDGYFIMFQIGHDPLVYIPTVSTTEYRRLSEATGYAGTVQLANVGISAFGRVWNAVTTTDKVTIQWSDTKNPVKWNTGTAGTLDLTSVWPSGGDVIVGLAAHNNRLFIFGKQHILIYKDASTPSTMTLEDAVNGIGAVGRDSIADTGTDVIFLSRTGVRSLARTIQEKSAPIRDISKNVRTQVIQYTQLEDENKILSTWNPVEAFYLLHFPTYNITYCFDTKQTLQDGSARVTTWTGVNPTALFSKVDGTLLIGKVGYVGTYSSYLDDTTAYRMMYYTTYTDFGSPLATSMLKKIGVVVIGGSDQVITTKWGYDYAVTYQSQQDVTKYEGPVGEYGIGEYGSAEYSSGLVINILKYQAGGSGKVAQVGIETDIAGASLSIQKLEIYAKQGKLA